jgi:RNA polymerase sigma-70 factor (ECF subfamily)
MNFEDRAQAALFERIVTPHMPAAWNLARWLLRSSHDAEDVLQDASLRALRSIDQYRGGDAKSWVLTIVRNLCHDLIRKRQTERRMTVSEGQFDEVESDAPGPLEGVERESEAQRLRRAIDLLPVEYREMLILREFEGLSYKEIAAIAEVPMGTVMSRLARARERLVQILSPAHAAQEGAR